MGTTVGIVIGFIGIIALIVPFILQIYVGTKQTSTNYKRALEAASGILVIGAIFFIGGLILAAYYEGKEIASYAGRGGKYIEQHPELLALL